MTHEKMTGKIFEFRKVAMEYNELYSARIRTLDVHQTKYSYMTSYFYVITSLSNVLEDVILFCHAWCLVHVSFPFHF